MRQDLKETLLPIIIVTGVNEAEDLANSVSVGVTDFIRKPYNPIELTARIRASLAMKWATDQLGTAESLLFTLARMVEAKDEKTGNHCSQETSRGWRDPERVWVFMEILRDTPKILTMPQEKLQSRDEEVFEYVASTGVLDWDRHFTR